MLSVSRTVVSNSLWPYGPYSPPGTSVHGIFQARILEWVAFLFSRGSSWPRGWTWVSGIAGGFFTIWATRECIKYVFDNLGESDLSTLSMRNSKVVLFTSCWWPRYYWYILFISAPTNYICKWDTDWDWIKIHDIHGYITVHLLAFLAV